MCEPRGGSLHGKEIGSDDQHAAAARAVRHPLGYRWALRLWKRRHGGSLLVLLAIAFIFGAWTGSQALLWGLVAFAIVAWLIARNRP